VVGAVPVGVLLLERYCWWQCLTPWPLPGGGRSFFTMVSCPFGEIPAMVGNSENHGPPAGRPVRHRLAGCRTCSNEPGRFRGVRPVRWRMPGARVSWPSAAAPRDRAAGEPEGGRPGAEELGAAERDE